MLTSSEVPAEADERKRDAGERQHRQVAGDRDGELARRQHDPGDRDPAEQRLTVVAELAAGADERGSPRVTRP